MDAVRRSLRTLVAALALAGAVAACSSDSGNGPSFGRSEPDLDDLGSRARSVRPPTSATTLPDAERAAVAQCLQENGHDVADDASIGDMLLEVGASEFAKCG